MDHARQHRAVRTSRVALTFLCCFLVTIFLLQWWQLPSYPPAVWSLLGFFGLFGFLGSPLSEKKTSSILLISSTLGITLAFLSVARTTHIATPETVDSYAHGKTVMFQGVINDAPDDRQTFINYTIAANTITLGSGSAIPVHGNVLATDKRRWPRFSYGDEVTVIGQLDHPKASDTFAYDNYLSRFNIYATERVTTIKLLSNNHGNPILATLIGLREGFEAQINNVYPEPHASFLAGLLTGSSPLFLY